jgi:hypothetical protein
VRLTTFGEEVLGKADALVRSIEDAVFGDLEPAARGRLDDTLRAALLRVAAP